MKRFDSASNLGGALSVALSLCMLGCGGARGTESHAAAEPRGKVGCSNKLGASGDSLITLTSGGLRRTALLHAPRAYDASKEAPLAVAYHFAHGTPELMKLVTSLDDAADERGFLIAYPAGVGKSWNAGKCCGEAWKEGVDDIQFTRDLIAAIEESHCIDKDRVYATGMSNGALMAERAGCELADRIAAIAPVAGAIDESSIAGAPGLGAACKSRPLSILEFHGTADSSMPYEGGLGHSPIPVDGDLDFMPVAESMAVWRGNDGCSAASSIVYAKGDVTCVAWSQCRGGTTAELCTVDGGGHTWPGGHMPLLFGKTSGDIDASQAMLDFFASHRRN